MKMKLVKIASDSAQVGKRNQREIRKVLLHGLVTFLHETPFPYGGPADQKNDKPAGDPQGVEFHTEDFAEHDLAGSGKHDQHHQCGGGRFP